LKEGGCPPSIGDTRCIVYGYVIRQAVNTLTDAWKPQYSIEEKLERIRQWFTAFGGMPAVNALTGEHAGEQAVTSGLSYSAVPLPLPIAVKGTPHGPLSL
jgi:hypothetical protein